MFTSHEKRSSVRKLIFLLVLFVVPSVPAWRGHGSERSLDNSVLSFTSRVYKEAANHAEPSSNLLLCPLSVQLLLSLLAEGAGGETLEEMRKVLSLPAETNAVSEYFFKLVEEFQDSNRDPKHQLLIATKMYTRKGQRINPKFKDHVRGFDADIEGLDFRQQTQSAKKINDWVALRTKNQITNLISPEDLTINTQLLLINALYFDAKWQTAFDPKNTTNLPFLTPSGKKYSVPMMRAKLRTKYSDIGELDVHAIEIQYHHYEYSMTILIPKRVDGLKDLESSLDQALDLVQSQLSYSADVTLEMPKFTMEDSLDYTKILQLMGIKEAFSERANFSKLTEDPGQRLGISKVISKTRMEVHEEGTIAAAATSVGAITLSIPQAIPEINLRLDRPFLFIITSQKHSAPIFIGRYVQPGKDLLIDNPTESRFGQPQNINNKEQTANVEEPPRVQPLSRPDQPSTSSRVQPVRQHQNPLVINANQPSAYQPPNNRPVPQAAVNDGFSPRDTSEVGYKNPRPTNPNQPYQPLNRQPAINTRSDISYNNDNPQHRDELSPKYHPVPQPAENDGYSSRRDGYSSYDEESYRPRPPYINHRQEYYLSLTGLQAFKPRK